MAALSTTGVDPAAIPEVMSNDQLEWWCVWSVCVAGKSAKQTAAKVNNFLRAGAEYECEHGVLLTPFEIVRMLLQHNILGVALRQASMGQYGRIEAALTGMVWLDVNHLTVEALEGIPGIGPKTARMIILYSQKNAEVVPLDTHILKYLDMLGYPDVPKSTPAAGAKYLRLESAFREEARYQEKSVRELDTEVWLQYSTKKEDDFEAIARSRSKYCSVEANAF
jgi:hypothetical protein